MKSSKRKRKRNEMKMRTADEGNLAKMRNGDVFVGAVGGPLILREKFEVEEEG